MKAPTVNLKKEEERSKRLIRTNYRGLIRHKYFSDFVAFLPSNEWTLVQPCGREVVHAVKEGRYDLRVWWDAQHKQYECNRIGMCNWYAYALKNDEVPI